MGDFSNVIGKVERDFKDTTIFNNSSFDMQPRQPLIFTDVLTTNIRQRLRVHFREFLWAILSVLTVSLVVFDNSSLSFSGYLLLGLFFNLLAATCSVFKNTSQQIIEGDDFTR